MTANGFANFALRPRELLWAGLFLAILAALLFPAILLSANSGVELTVWMQAGLIVLATLGVQVLRRQSPWEVTGRPNLRWLRDLGVGVGLGALLWLGPALLLAVGGWVEFRPVRFDGPGLGQAALLMAGVAFAEELLFRGVLFQRLIAAFGVWPAQIVLAALFVLTHLGNPHMDGATKLWASANIFLASIMFGLAYVRTRSLALPIGLHLMANFTQGSILGFGVSGQAGEISLLTPDMAGAPDWLTGGAFGLEASLPGLVAVFAIVLGLALFRVPGGTRPA
jgi:membrane protease YdiL (CAAX protease family)